MNMMKVLDIFFIVHFVESILYLDINGSWMCIFECLYIFYEYSEHVNDLHKKREQIKN